MKRLVAIIAVVLLVAIAAMATDDARFWWRWFQRVPAMVGLAGPEGANAVPDLQATIAGGDARPIPACRNNTPALAEAAREAQAWLATRKTEAFLVWHDGCLVTEHYASGDAATLRPAGAMAKSLMALATGAAIRQGAIPGLDARVARQLPEWRDARRAAIRYRDMLTMHAGLQWYRQQASPFSDFQRIIIGSDYASRAVALRSAAEPGRFYDYSAWTYDLLGIALARGGGAPYEDLVSRWLSRPLGLSDMTIYVDRPGGTVHGNCCLHSRADDWIRLGALVVDEARQPRLLADGFVAEMGRPGADQPNYGLGAWLGTPYTPRREIASRRNPYPTPVKSVIAQSEPFLADDVMVFEGVGQTKTWIVPSRALVIVRFGKAPKDWDDAVVPNLLLGALAP